MYPILGKLVLPIARQPPAVPSVHFPCPIFARPLSPRSGGRPSTHVLRKDKHHPHAVAARLRAPRTVNARSRASPARNSKSLVPSSFLHPASSIPGYVVCPRPRFRATCHHSLRLSPVALRILARRALFSVVRRPSDSSLSHRTRLARTYSCDPPDRSRRLFIGLIACGVFIFILVFFFRAARPGDQRRHRRHLDRVRRAYDTTPARLSETSRPRADRSRRRLLRVRCASIAARITSEPWRP